MTDVDEPVRPPSPDGAAWLRASPLVLVVKGIRQTLWRWVYAPLVRRRAGVQALGALHVRGMPHIDLVPGARVVLGHGVMLNSSNAGYHLNMFAPVKLLADLPGAEIIVGDGTRLHGTCVHAYERVEIGRNCLIAANTQIMDGSGHDLAFDDPSRRGSTRGPVRPVRIGDNVWIGAQVIVLPGSIIGEGSVVGAGSVVSGTVPPRVLAAGNPIRVLRDYLGAPELDSAL